MVRLYIILFIVVMLSELSILCGLLLCRDSKIKKRYKNYMQQKFNNEYQFYLLIPMFDEAQIVEETYDYFCQLITPNVHCVFITTEKENNLFGCCKTKEMLEVLMIEKPCENVYLYHYPGITGNKVDQLNAYLSTYKERLNRPDTFIVDFDCDSRPDKEMIAEFCSILHNVPQANIIQQSTQFWAKNRNNVLLKNEAIFQTRWAFGYERFHQYLSTFKWFNKLFVPYYYCVGHGLCIRASFLYQLGLFTGPLEDLTLGMMMTLKQEPIYPCYTKDKGEVVTSVKALLRQAGHWVRGPLNAVGVLRKATESTHISIYRQCMYLLRMTIDFISWIQYLGLFLISLFLIKQSASYLLVYMLFLYIFSMVSVLITLKYYCNEKIKIDFCMICLMPVRHFMRGISVISCIYQYYFGWFYDKKKNK